MINVDDEFQYPFSLLGQAEVIEIWHQDLLS